MKLNHSKLKSFFIGTLLGDSYIHNDLFCCKQISKDLIEFKANIIKTYLPGINVRIIEHPERIDKNNVKHQRYWELRTSRHRYITKLRKIFYPNGRKVYPHDAILKLDSLGFSMWFADDGTSILVQLSSNLSAKSRRVQLCTDSFTLDEHYSIKKNLEELGYNVSIIDRHRNNQYRIQINKPQKFICFISQHFFKFPSLLYKIDLGYRNSSLDSNYVSKEYKDVYLKIKSHPEFIDRIQSKILKI